MKNKSLDIMMFRNETEEVDQQEVSDQEPGAEGSEVAGEASEDSDEE